MIKDIIINVSKDFTRKEYSEYLLKEIKSLTKICAKYNDINEQWFLDFEDELNAISIKDYNKEEK